MQFLIQGLPPAVGIYSSLIPTFLYSLFATSRHLSVGPISLTAVMTSVVVSSRASPNGVDDPEANAGLAAALSLSVGIFLLIMAFFRMGFVENLLSKPIKEGFITGLAFTIISGQLPGLLGIPKSPKILHTVWENLIYFFENIGHGTKREIGMGIACLLLQFGMKWLKRYPRFSFLRFIPGVLVVTVLATTISFSAGFEAQGVRILGHIDAGFPVPRLPSFSPSFFSSSLAPGLIIAFVGFIEAMAVNRQMAAVHEYFISANSEMFAVGIANTAGAFFQAMPVFGSIGRTLANSAAGGRTQLAGLLASLVMLVFCFSARAFYHLPKCTVSSIIIVVISSLIDFFALPRMYRMALWIDLSFFLTSFVLTLGLGIENGIILSSLISALYVVRRGTIPSPTFLGRVPGTAIYKTLTVHGDASPIENLVIVQPGTSLFYFINTSHLKKVLMRILDGRGPMGGVMPSWLCRGEAIGLIIDFTNVEHCDFTGSEVLEEIYEMCCSSGILFGISSVRGLTRRSLKNSALGKHMSARYFCGDLHSIATDMVQRIRIRITITMVHSHNSIFFQS